MTACEVLQDLQAKFGVAVIGGGLSGILTTLRLSRGGRGNGVVLLENQPVLGGRLFFGKSSSGIGFELFSANAAQALERHLRTLLDEAELEIVESTISESRFIFEGVRKVFFAKKEIVPLDTLLSAPSDFLTRKDAEILAQFCIPKTRTPNEPNISNEPFEKSQAWRALGRSQQESLAPILETIVATDFLKLPEDTVRQLCEELPAIQGKSVSPWFAAGSHLEIALEQILRRRGVTVLTSATVRQVQREQELFNLFTFVGTHPEPIHLKALKTIICTPLVRAMNFLPRDFLIGTQIRWMQRNLPKSMVAVIYPQFQELLSSNASEKLFPGSRIFFPVERLQALITTTGNLIFLGFLDYESSLDAPAVRDTISRIRRAAARIFRDDQAEKLEFRNRVITERGISERIVLVPVGRFIRRTRDEHTNPRTGIPDLFVCGDGFTFAPEPWQNIVDSVHAVSGFLGGSI